MKKLYYKYKDHVHKNEQFFTKEQAEAELNRQGKRSFTIKEVFAIWNLPWKTDRTRSGVFITFPKPNSKKTIDIFFPIVPIGIVKKPKIEFIIDKLITGIFYSDIFDLYPNNGASVIRAVSGLKNGRQAHVMLDGKPMWIDLHNLKYKKHIKPYQNGKEN